MVAATQNPIEYEGTYPLPEAQLDRFAMRLSLGYPPLADEARMLTQQTSEPPQDVLEPVCSAADVLAVAEDAKARLRRGERQPLRRRGRCGTPAPIRASTSARARARGSRCCGSPRHGRSPPAARFVSPDDVKAVAEPVLAHRLIVAPEARSPGSRPRTSSATRSRRRPFPV